ncbi:MAG: UvrD-helicase domain-containing protein, partial [Clostridia bacterium]|nr:UvrD-helicase domain-containing protein [Clostridia bacterium]
MNKPEKTFDIQQQVILDCNDQHQLVSAGAGSGKTTVMIQKITDLLLMGNVPTSEILVVTFTNLAAVEMRDRLVKKLGKVLSKASDDNEKARIQNIIDSIETASVDTIDGFCSKMLKKYFYKSGLEPEIKIISSFSQQYYINKALDMAIKNFNETNESDLIVLCDIFEKKSRSLDELKKNLLRAFNYCVCQKDYDKFLDSILLQYKDLNSPSAQYVNEYIHDKLHAWVNQILRLLPSLTDFVKTHTMLDNYCSHLLKIQSTNLTNTIQVLTSCPECNFSHERIKDNDDYKQIQGIVKSIKAFCEKLTFLYD